MKFPIALFFVVFACLASQAYCQEDNVVQRDGFFDSLVEGAKKNLDEAKKAFDAMIDRGFKAVKDSLTKAQELMDQAADAINSSADKVNKTVEDYLQGILSKLDAEVAAVQNGVAEGKIENSECLNLAQKLRQDALNVASKANQCVAQKMEDGQNTMEEMRNNAYEILEELKSNVDEANACVHSVESIGTIMPAVGCLAKTQVKANWIVLKRIPAMTVEIAKLSGFALTVPASLGYCASRHAFLQLQKESAQVIEALQKCGQSALPVAA
ncbi:hypothetical protein TKK_0010405 [Trichogramma kaykai]